MKLSLPSFFPNLLSLLRVLIGAVITFLLYLPPSVEGLPLWSALILFIMGVATDFWDGWLARRHRLETSTGKILDPTADKVFILSCMASFAARGVYSPWWLAPVFLRETAVSFCRIAWLHQGRAVGAERAGKIKFGLQVASVSFSFIYLLAPHPATVILNKTFLIAAVLATVTSGISFFKNNQKLLGEAQFLRTVAALGVGYLKPAPGTYGTLLGLAMVPLIAHDPLLHLFILSVFIALTYAVVPRLGLAEGEDPLEIVLDEVCGILLAFLALPLNMASLLAGFLLFRIFDVSKLFPLNWLEKRKGVHGILWDDLGAGLYTWIALRILFA